ncbi:MAG TPA: hypothetical protein VFS08_17085 [Gemmatimonadaceae bacterium]|nr:hypothetical protein [Gemmatimonadaceae bacterium]
MAGKSASKSTAGKRTRSGRERMNLLIDPRLLRAAAVALGTTNKSDAVNVALERLAEDAAILRELGAATGEIPDYPCVDT